MTTSNEAREWWASMDSDDQFIREQMYQYERDRYEAETHWQRLINASEAQAKGWREPVQLELDFTGEWV